MGKHHHLGFSRATPFCLSVLLLVSFIGCASFDHRVARREPLLDESSTSSNLSAKKYTRIMVIPPSADTKGGGFEEQLASAEREFLRRGMTLISPAVTGRVYDREGLDSRTIDLTDMERALILAKDSNTEALLQIGTFRWEPIVESKRSQRYFIAVKNPGSVWYSPNPKYTFNEVDRAQYVNHNVNERIALSAEYLIFTGRLVDVQDGEVVASFSLCGMLVHNLSQDYNATLVRGDSPGTWAVQHSNYDFNGEWQRDAKRDLVDMVFSRIADTIIGAR